MRWQQELLVAVLCLLTLPSAVGERGGEGGGTDHEMREYCRRLYGEMSYFSDELDQCMCVRGYAFNGMRCVPERDSTPASPPRPAGSEPWHSQQPPASAGPGKTKPPLFGESEVGEWCPGLPPRSPVRIVLGLATRWLTRIKVVQRVLRAIGEFMGFSFEREDAYQACVEKRASIAKNSSALKQAHYDVLKLENRHLFSSLQNLLQQEENLRKELDETIVTRETALERVGRSIEEGKRRAAELEREKNQLVRSLQSGKGGDEGRAKEAERLKEINEQLSFSVKMAQQRTEGQAGKEKEVMSMLEQHREREREMMRELRELRGLIEKGDTQAIVKDAVAKQGGGEETEYSARCRRKFGENAQWDGKGGCKCTDGYMVRDKKCVRKPRGPKAGGGR